MPNINPGPGEYVTEKKIGLYKPKVSFKGQKDFQLKSLITPSPQHYTVSTSQVLSNRYPINYQIQTNIHETEFPEFKQNRSDSWYL